MPSRPISWTVTELAFLFTLATVTSWPRCCPSKITHCVFFLVGTAGCRWATSTFSCSNWAVLLVHESWTCPDPEQTDCDDMSTKANRFEKLPFLKDVLNLTLTCLEPRRIHNVLSRRNDKGVVGISIEPNQYNFSKKYHTIVPDQLSSFSVYSFCDNRLSRSGFGFQLGGKVSIKSSGGNDGSLATGGGEGARKPRARIDASTSSPKSVPSRHFPDDL